MVFDSQNSITALSNQAWLERHSLKLDRYLRRNHIREDRFRVFSLLFYSYPDEGRKLIENFDISEEKKKELFLSFIVFSPQITCGIFADQRMGKDALLNKVFEDVFEFCDKIGRKRPRVVTLGNIRRPPFVDEKDMYFSFKNIPSGTKEQEVWIYSSEIETVLPARDTQSPENKLFSHLEGTMAQNHQKLFGCCKLASKVDLNFIRGMNVKLFKFISPEKLQIGNVERVGVLSELGHWLLPKDSKDKTKTLLCFDNQLFQVSYSLPLWWSQEYSEQFNNVPIEKVYEYIDCFYEDKMNLSTIQTAVAQKFRRVMSLEVINEYINTHIKNRS